MLNWTLENEHACMAATKLKAEGQMRISPDNSLLNFNERPSAI